MITTDGSWTSAAVNPHGSLAPSAVRPGPNEADARGPPFELAEARIKIALEPPVANRLPETSL
jgi:hypothetical protein